MADTIGGPIFAGADKVAAFLSSAKSQTNALGSALQSDVHAAKMNVSRNGSSTQYTANITAGSLDSINQAITSARVLAAQNDAAWSGVIDAATGPQLRLLGEQPTEFEVVERGAASAVANTVHKTLWALESSLASLSETFNPPVQFPPHHDHASSGKA